MPSPLTTTCLLAAIALAIAGSGVALLAVCVGVLIEVVLTVAQGYVGR